MTTAKRQSSKATAATDNKGREGGEESKHTYTHFIVFEPPVVEGGT